MDKCTTGITHTQITVNTSTYPDVVVPIRVERLVKAVVVAMVAVTKRPLQQRPPHAVEGAEEPVVGEAPPDSGRREAVDGVTVVVADSWQHQRVREVVLDEIRHSLVGGDRLMSGHFVDVVGRVVTRPQNVGDVLGMEEDVTPDGARAADGAGICLGLAGSMRNDVMGSVSRRCKSSDKLFCLFDDILSI